MTAASLTLFPLLAGPARPARVSAIVSGAVYLEVDPATDDDGRHHPGAVVALLDPAAVQLPIGLTLPPGVADLVPVSVDGAPVSPGPIVFGHGAVSMAGTRLPVLRWWNPTVPKQVLPPPAPEMLPTALLDGLLDEAAQPLAEGLDLLRSGDTEAAFEALLGTGPGLTPAGDDALVGALAALAAWAPRSTAHRLLADGVAAADGRTTAISAALLRSAVTGAVVPQLTRFVGALSTGDPAAIRPALDEVLPVGASSGAAMAAGAVAQLTNLMQGPSRRRRVAIDATGPIGASAVL
ncbi:DUF2877 domain-containing protein [Kineosporia sp. J2-2]|uniref:DUF2877 domain-containing protein n=1 Tax=Kineosporia corallincola TaxID=2835133 RepID=A0ABS5TND0_9ACTN|nr:DUF2877 domain-containing protein [Kineosporia corallincola]MBT0772606.1 DUF2877 domain-containing protein [Kineosporia corallincola]